MNGGRDAFHSLLYLMLKLGITISICTFASGYILSLFHLFIKYSIHYFNSINCKHVCLVIRCLARYGNALWQSHKYIEKLLKCLYGDEWQT